jgi:hypothetical protein
MTGAPAGGRGGGGGGGPATPVVDTGDYLVTLRVGGQTQRQVLRVERVSGGEDTGGNGEERGDRPRSKSR